MHCGEDLLGMHVSQCDVMTAQHAFHLGARNDLLLVVVDGKRQKNPSTLTKLHVTISLEEAMSI